MGEQQAGADKTNPDDAIDNEAPGQNLFMDPDDDPPAGCECD